MCRCGVLTAEWISMNAAGATAESRLTGALRLGGEDGSIGSFGGDCSAARRRRHGSIGTCLQRGEGGRVDIEALLCVLVLVQLGVVVDVGAG